MVIENAWIDELHQFFCTFTPCRFKPFFRRSKPQDQLLNVSWKKKFVVLYSVNQKKGKKAYNTCYSQAVTHPSTTQAQHCLTSVIRRELVYSVWYGSRQLLHSLHIFSMSGQLMLQYSFPWSTVASKQYRVRTAFKLISQLEEDITVSCTQ